MPEHSPEQETFGACAWRTTITSSILRTLKLALELRVANPSLLFDTRAACRGNEARVGYVQRPTYSNEIRAANRERKGGNSVFPKAAITYGGITVKCAPLRREKWPLCGCSRLRSSDGFFLALAILLISRVVAASTALHPPSFPLQSWMLGPRQSSSCSPREYAWVRLYSRNQPSWSSWKNDHANHAVE